MSTGLVFYFNIGIYKKMRFLYRYQLVLFILGMESFRQKNKHSNILIMKKCVHSLF